MTENKIFDGLKVIELASVLAGPAVGMFFAELGASVVKIENARTGGDVTRSWKIPGEIPGEKSAYYHSVNWNKEVRMMDLSDELEYEKLLEEIHTADIVIVNFRKESAKKLKLDYQTLKNVNKWLIYGEINAYGQQSDKAGFDAVIQAETGWMSINGEANSAGLKLPVALMDILAAHQLKEGLLIALLQKAKTGKGSKVSVSLFDSAISALANQASNWLNAGHLPQPLGNLHPNIAPYGEVLIASDQQPMLLAVGTDRQFKGICEILGIEHLTDDPKFVSNKQRVINRQELQTLLQERAGQKTSLSLLSQCAEKNVPVAPIRDIANVFSSEGAKKLILREEESDGTISKRVKTAIFEIE